MHRILLVICLFGWIAAVAQAPDFDSYTEEPLPPKSFDEEQYREAVEGLDYYEPPPKQRESGAHEPPKSTLFSGISPIIKALFFLVVIGLLAFIIYKLLGGSMELESKKVRRGERVSIEDLEKNLHHADLRQFLQESLDKGDLRLAVRIYYLMVLRTLSERNLIQWSIDKTNREYVREMQTHSSRHTFRDLTRWFEQIWYGDYPLPEARFRELDRSFQAYLNEITPKSQSDA